MRRADESNFGPTRRKDRIAILVEAGTHPRDMLSSEVIDTDQSVVGPFAHEGEPLAIARERDGADSPVIDDQRLRRIAAHEIRSENLRSVDEYQPFAIRREFR